MPLIKYWPLALLLFLTSGCGTASNDALRIERTLTMLRAKLERASPDERHQLPGCKRALRRLESEGANALDQPIILWATVYPVYRHQKPADDTSEAKRRMPCVLDVSWLSLDDDSINGLYFVDGKGQKMQAQPAIEAVDMGASYSVRVNDEGNLEPVRDTSVATAWKRAMFYVVESQDELNSCPVDEQHIAIVLPPSMSDDDELQMGFVLKDGQKTDAVNIVFYSDSAQDRESDAMGNYLKLQMQIYRDAGPGVESEYLKWKERYENCKKMREDEAKKREREG